MTRAISGSTPLLLVGDLDRAIAFYVDVLGYEDPMVAGDPPTFCMLHRGPFDLMLKLTAAADVRSNGQAGAWDLYLVVPDVEAERRAIEAAGARVIGAPRDTEYEMRELEIEDPDGHRICLGQTLSS